MNLFAFNKNKKLISIDEVDTKRDTKYYCCLCEDEMIAKKGKIRSHHFAHKSETNCNYESYLHKIGKLKFLKEYKHCLKNKIPFYIEYKTKEICNACQNIENLGLSCKEVLIKPFDITKRFDKISMEKLYKGFIADILLESSVNPNEKIFIEFAVTHKCEEEKLSSGIRIIEVELVNEKDLKFIDNHKISINQDYTENLKIQNSNHLVFSQDDLPFGHHSITESIIHHKITYYNFKIEKRIFKKFTPHNCNKEINTFVIYKNNKAVRKCIKMKNLINQLSSFKHIEIIGPKKSKLTRIDEDDFYEEEYENAYNFRNSVIKAAFKFRDFKNCYSCRFSTKNNNKSISDIYGSALFCKLKKNIIKNSNEGSNCKKYWQIEKGSNN